MFALLMGFFIILVVILAIFILIQQGKGDLGLGSMGGTQALFGGSGGQDFFEKTTWTLGFLFIFGSLGLAILKSKERNESKLAHFTTESIAPQQEVPAHNHTQDHDQK